MAKLYNELYNILDTIENTGNLGVKTAIRKSKSNEFRGMAKSCKRWRDVSLRPVFHKSRITGHSETDRHRLLPKWVAGKMAAELVGQSAAK